MSKAHQYHRHYPNYLWIVPGWYSDNWWKEFPDYLTTLNCTLTQVEQVLNRSLTLLPVPGHLNSTTAGVITTLLNPSSYAADAVRALALALNETLMNNNCRTDGLPWESCVKNLSSFLQGSEIAGLTVSCFVFLYLLPVYGLHVISAILLPYLLTVFISGYSGYIVL